MFKLSSSMMFACSVNGLSSLSFLKRSTSNQEQGILSSGHVEAWSLYQDVENPIDNQNEVSTEQRQALQKRFSDFFGDEADAILDVAEMPRHEVCTRWSNEEWGLHLDTSTLTILEIHDGQWADRTGLFGVYVGWRIVGVNDHSVSNFHELVLAKKDLSEKLKKGDVLNFTLQKVYQDERLQRRWSKFVGRATEFVSDHDNALEINMADDVSISESDDEQMEEPNFDDKIKKIPSFLTKEDTGAANFGLSMSVKMAQEQVNNAKLLSKEEKRKNSTVYQI